MPSFLSTLNLTLDHSHPVNSRCAPESPSVVSQYFPGTVYKRNRQLTRRVLPQLMSLDGRQKPRLPDLVKQEINRKKENYSSYNKVNNTHDRKTFLSI